MENTLIYNENSEAIEVLSKESQLLKALLSVYREEKDFLIENEENKRFAFHSKCTMSNAVFNALNGELSKYYVTPTYDLKLRKEGYIFSVYFREL